MDNLGEALHISSKQISWYYVLIRLAELIYNIY